MRGQTEDADALTPADKDAAEQQIIEQSRRIEFYITEYSVEILANKMRSGDYVVPNYQREFTWEPDRKSRFIESLIMGLPIPFIFFWEMPNGRLEVVDGSQRLRTLEEFLLGNFRLGELDQLTRISGFRFRDLPESRQRKIVNRSIRGIVLNEHADESARLDMFERINTSSKIANPAEIRRGALAGPFMDLVVELSEDPLLQRLAPISAKTKKERGYEELVTRFFAYGDGLEGYRDRPKEFMFNYTKSMNERLERDAELATSYRDRFSSTMSFIDRVFPYGFRKNERSKATPRARFESIAIGSYRALNERPELATVDPTKLSVLEWLNSEEFVEVTGSDGANAKERVRSRIGFVYNRLAKA